ncbi:LysM peptidoglycan-binding domain-containing M23 family metallopeptidase [Feifania hominis]|uniref:Peptidoglycan DD-metalloendopeptidase family protein n=1 Tax=Feifania hominis TaxID=2763660 RepID=A0A926DE33_9FIRM|nr:M23 family metallopeptidase [Feifania hominis]MBC8536918.1 peptidoglycan DD-metalloendopeptidase family protein [Feifania hominis]
MAQKRAGTKKKPADARQARPTEAKDGNKPLSYYFAAVLRTALRVIYRTGMWERKTLRRIARKTKRLWNRVKYQILVLLGRKPKIETYQAKRRIPTLFEEEKQPALENRASKTEYAHVYEKAADRAAEKTVQAPVAAAATQVQAAPQVAAPQVQAEAQTQAAPQAPAEPRVPVYQRLFIAFLSLISGYPKEEITLPLSASMRKKCLHATVARSLSYVAPVMALAALTVLIISAKDYTLGVKVAIDGENVAVLQSEEQYDEILLNVERYVANITGEYHHIDAEPTFQTTLVNKNLLEDHAALEDKMIEKAGDVITESYGLYLDGELIAVNSDGAAMQDVLDGILDSYRSGAEGERVEFIQNLRIERDLLPKKQEKSLFEITQMLTATSVGEVTYTVQKNDTLSKIASKCDMKLTELTNLNEGVDPMKLKVGMKLTVAKPVPAISVKVVKNVTYEESIPYEVVSSTTGDLYKNQVKVTTKGVNGVAQVEAEVCLVDNEEVSRLELSRTVVSEPVTQVELRGTKALPAKAPTGTFRRPLSGTITSRFGVKRGKSYHTGLDIAAKRGTVIVAADGGTVTFAGWSGNYGKLVKIDHGNGLVTYYAHCDTLLVSKGDKVAKGESIAKVGSTGNSTGPHLHLEVRKNGKPVNPTNYVNY